eukprot:GHVS01106133.1.p1 GENE.GHVS01106133.1~~GHVS01106133.1.p1  ORF type:complete len:182 (-),score=34.09 GHVS01106133.1:31-576(-)
MLLWARAVGATMTEQQSNLGKTLHHHHHHHEQDHHHHDHDHHDYHPAEAIVTLSVTPSTTATMLQQSRPMDSPSSSRDDGSSGPPSQCSSGNTSTSGLFTDELFSVATPTAGAAVCTASTATGHDTIMINTTSSREDTTDAALSLTYTSSHVSRTTKQGNYPQTSPGSFPVLFPCSCRCKR